MRTRCASVRKIGLYNVYKVIVDEWTLYDCGGDEPIIIGSGEKHD
jgi:hypothetical protein